MGFACSSSWAGPWASLPKPKARGILIFTSFDIKYVRLSKYDIELVNCLKKKDFTSFS